MKSVALPKINSIKEKERYEVIVVGKLNWGFFPRFPAKTFFNFMNLS